MKNLIFLVVLVTSQLNAQELKYQIDSNNSVFYEEIIIIPNNSKNEIHDKIIEYLKSNDFVIQDENEDKIFATGIFEVKFRKFYFLFMNATSEPDCVYDLLIELKDKKIRYKASNFVLLKKKTDFNSLDFTSNELTNWSTSNIPEELISNTVDRHYKYGKSKHIYKLFPTIDSNMLNFEKGLKNSISW